MRHGIAASRCRTDATNWRIWATFCADLGIPTDLQGIDDPIPVLQIFAIRVRSGVLAAAGKKVKKRQVEQYLRSVGQIFACVGAKDPRLDNMGKVDFRLRRQLTCYEKEDPPPTRVRPVPITLLLDMHTRALRKSDVATHIAELALVAFFFLLRPGEYCQGDVDSRSAPFRLRDVSFFVGPRRYAAMDAPAHILRSATFVSLRFNDQKNGVKGESLGHGTTAHSIADPVKLLASIVLRLRAAGANAETPLAHSNSSGKWKWIKSATITAAMRASADKIGESLGFSRGDISARSMRAGGAMALLLSNVDTDKIKLLGRWRSDAMMRYLHTTARPLVQGFAANMVSNGDYAQIPS